MGVEDQHHDVIVIGGGPGGATCATLLARAGRSVLVLEREQFPRFHIGESLTAFAAGAFKQLGVYDELKAINYVQKRGLEFVLPHKSKKIYFPEHLRNEPGELPWAFQMPRAALDMVLLRNAERCGATVRQQHLVTELLFEGERAVGVAYQDRSRSGKAKAKRAYARWIIDTAGERGVVNQHVAGNAYSDPLLANKISLFSHWRGELGIANSDEELNFKLCVHPNGADWAWYLPIDRNLVSVGIVVDQHSAMDRDRDLETFFASYIAEIPFISEFMQNPGLERVEKLRGARDFSFRVRRYYGPGWALAGDSAGFIDPIFSTGLQITFNSAFELAEAIDQVLDQTEIDYAPLDDYAANLERFYRINAMLVYRFYECGLDPARATNPLTPINWASMRHRLRCMWVAAKLIPHRRRVIENWTREVLFGSVQDGNKIADLFLVLAENYEALVGQQFSTPSPRMEAREPA